MGNYDERKWDYQLSRFTQCLFSWARNIVNWVGALPARNTSYLHTPDVIRYWTSGIRGFRDHCSRPIGSKDVFHCYSFSLQNSCLNFFTSSVSTDGNLFVSCLICNRYGKVSVCWRACHKRLWVSLEPDASRSGQFVPWVWTVNSIFVVFPLVCLRNGETITCKFWLRLLHFGCVTKMIT